MKKSQVINFWRKWLKKKKLYEQINRPDVRFLAIRKYIKGKNVLDFGYGTGWFIKKLAKEGFNVIGIEFLGSRKIQKRKNVILISLNSVKDLSKLSFKEKFDTIIASEVLEHLTKDEINKTLKFFYNWLKEGGKLIVTVPYKEKIEEKILCPYCLRWFHPWLHKQSFDESNIRELLKKYGFYVEKIEYITFIEFWNITSVLKHFLNFIFTRISRRGRIWMLIVSKISF
jgi:cyclopropane fatty-acyl-phospholipid synthase-like methyltransferase